MISSKRLKKQPQAPSNGKPPNPSAWSLPNEELLSTVEETPDGAGAGRWLFPVAAFLLPFAVFLIGLRYLGSGDTEPAELLPISLLREGDLDFNEFVAGADLPYCYRRVGERVVSAYSIVPGLLNVPVFFVADLFSVDLYARRLTLSLVTSSLITALATLFLFLALTRVCQTRREALFLGLVFAFATCVWSVASRGMWQHGPSLLFLSGALWALLTREERKIPLAGLMLGLAVANRPTNLVIAVSIALYVLRRRRGMRAAFLALAAPPLLLVSLYSAHSLQRPFALGQAYTPGGFTGNMLTGLAGLLVSPSRGLFVFSPILLFSVIGGVLAWRSGSEPLFRYLSVGTIFLVLLYSSWGMWWGGVSFGYRLILEIVPVAILLLALAWKEVVRKRLILRAAFLALLGFSVYIQCLGAFVYPSEFNDNLDLETARLWDVRDSELVLLSEKLLGRTPRSAAASAVPSFWWTPEKNDDSIPGWLDGSPGGKLVRGTLEISGWTKSASGEVDVRVLLNGDRVVLPERFPRPDVAALLPHLGDTSRAGFRTVFPAPPGRQSEHTLVVELRDLAGRVRRLGPIRFRWER